MMAACGPAGLGRAGALRMCGARSMTTAGAADPIGPAALSEHTDGCEQCCSRCQLLLRSGAATLLDGQCYWIATQGSHL